jgi:hypothetical protein
VSFFMCLLLLCLAAITGREGVFAVRAGACPH